MNNTNLFNVNDIENAKVSDLLITVYRNLEERGYNPSSQIIGYLITGDPGYITSYKNSRDLITSIDREKILDVVLKDYMNKNI